MPSISPAINIGIGNYGASCMSDLASNFCLREGHFVDYVSFHQLNLVGERISMYNFNFETQNFQEYKLNAEKNTESEQDFHSWQLHNFVSQAYGSLITLTNKLALNVNYHAIHINLIFAAYEIEHLELLKETILIINQLRKQGDFGEVKVKCFSILSDGEGVATPMQEENISRTLETIVEIRNENDVLSHNFILDDKNTQAVMLRVANNYLAFAISEIIVALIRNEYKMLGALHNRNGTISIGIGMVYFDRHYFTAFINNKILESKIEIEKLHGRKTKINTTKYIQVVENALLPFVKNSVEIDALIKDIQNVISPGNFESTLRCYEFLLTNILGKHDRVSLVDPIEANELYAIDDLIYHLLYHQVITNNEKGDNGFLRLKDYKDKLTEYNAKIRDGIDASNSEMIEEHQLLEKHKNEVENIIKYYANPTWRKQIDPIHNVDSISKQIKQLKESQVIEERDFKKKGIIKRFCGRRKYTEKKKKTEELIKNLENEMNSRGEHKTKLQSDLNKLYALRTEAMKLLNILDKGIKDIHTLKVFYQAKIDNLPYLDFEFIQNIISTKKLVSYEETNRKKLQSNIKESLRILFEETVQKEMSFSHLLDSKINKTTNDIIDFKMTYHLLNEYDSMNLLISFNFDEDLKKLKHRSLPFFNAIPTYKNKSHYLKYFNDSEKKITENIEKLMEDNYTGSLPTTIYSKSENKFALITIDVIEDLKSIVKYNNHYLKSSTK